MPLVASIDHGSHYKIHLWQMTSEDDHLRNELEVQGVDMKPIAGWHSKRQLEWIVGRYMAHSFLPDKISDLILSPSGKPYFEEGKTHFSISHSGDMLGLIVSELTVGLDIQKYSKTVQKVSHKFISEDNLSIFSSNVSDSDRQHILWCTKEAVFKAYGKGKVDFRQDISVASYENLMDYAIIKGRLRNDQVDKTFVAHSHQLESYFIVSVVLE